MKKSLIRVGVLLIALLALTGCGTGDSEGGKKLVCTSSEGRLSEEITFNFKDNKISKVKLVYTSEQDSKEEAQENKDNLLTLLSATYGNPEYYGYDYTVTVNGNKIVGTMNVDYSKVNDEFKETLTSGTTYEEVKKEIEANGATCK